MVFLHFVTDLLVDHSVTDNDSSIVGGRGKEWILPVIVDRPHRSLVVPKIQQINVRL